MSFPLSPTNGQTAVLNGITYSYSSASTLWTRVTAAVPNTIKSTSSTTPPTNPNIGDIWYNTLTDGTYRYTSDGTVSYWLDFTGPTMSTSANVTLEPTFFAYAATGGQSLTGAAQTKISFSNKNWDTAGAFNNTASPVTLNGLTVPAYSFCPPVAGYYQLTGMVQTTADIKGSIDFCKNGSFDATNGGRAALGQFQGPAGTIVVYLNGVGDYVDMRIYVATTTAVQTQAGANYFQAVYLGTGTGLTAASNSNGFAYPTWTTASRPTAPSAGTAGYNTSLSGVEIYNGTAWAMISGGPAFLAGINSSTDATLAAGTAVPANITQYNIANCYSTSTYRFTAPIAGLYKFTVGIYFTNSGAQTQSMQVGLRKNGSYQSGGSDAYAVITVQPNAFAGGTNQSVLTAQFLLSENDYIDVSPRGANSLRHFQGHYWFQGYLIG